MVIRMAVISAAMVIYNYAAKTKGHVPSNLTQYVCKPVNMYGSMDKYF